MLLRLRFFLGTSAVAAVCLSASGRIYAQQPAPLPAPTAVATLPDAPQPQSELLDAVSMAQPPAAETPQTPASDQQTPTPAQNNPAQASTPQSSSAQAAAQPGTEKSQQETAEQQLKEQEHQRVAGVMATFNTTRNRNALPLSPGQKFRLFFRSSTDPWPFLLAGVVAGIGQADNSPTEWGQGLQGYAKRFGGNYTDAFIGNFFGNAVLPVILREDPRYFQKGSGSHIGRLLWAASSTFWCRRDNGKWGPNYANVGGNMIGSAIARAYYPASERDAYDTIMDGFTVSVEGIVGAEVIEFWPDLVRHHKRKHDEKMARRAAQAAGNR